MATQAHSLSYAGCNFLRQRLVLSTLSGRPVKIRRIRARDDNPGLRGDLGRGREEGGGCPGSQPGVAAGRVGGMEVGRRGDRSVRELRHAWNVALRLLGANSKQLHVFLVSLLLRIAHSLPSLESLAFAITSQEKNSLLD